MMPTSPPQEIEVHSIGSVRNVDVANIPLPETRELVEYSSWTTGLCSCTSDMHVCCLVTWFPCIAFGRIAEIANKGNLSCCVCGSLYFFLYLVSMTITIVTYYPPSLYPFSSIFGMILSCIYRRKLKRNLNMRPNFVRECCCDFCCEPCALCQEYRELQNRGYDLSLGWDDNMLALNPQHFRPPEVPTMNR